MTDLHASEVVQLARVGQVLQICLNRPDRRNALNLAALRGLAAAYTQLSNDPDLRAGVVWAKGDVFCAGLDLADVMPAAIADGSSCYLQPGLCDPFRLYAPGCRKPIVVAVQGPCFTAGLELTLAADVCIAATDARFAQQETTRGIMPMGGATFRLPARIGWNRAMRCMLAGETFDAAQAADCGLASEVCPRDALLTRAMALAERIAASAPLAVEATLENARIGEERGGPAAIAHLEARARQIAQTGDAQEGLLSLLQKRAPLYRGA